MVVVDGGHERSGRGKDVVYEDENSLLRRQLDALPHDVHKLAYGQVLRDQVLLLVNVGDIGALVLLANNGDAVRVLGPDALRFAFAFFCVYPQRCIIYIYS